MVIQLLKSKNISIVSHACIYRSTRFLLSLLGTHRFYILNQRPIAPNPFAVALEAPGDGDFNNTQFSSHDASFDVLLRY